MSFTYNQKNGDTILSISSNHLSDNMENTETLNIYEDDQRYRQALEWISNFWDYIFLDHHNRKFRFASESAEKAFLKASYYPSDGTKEDLMKWVSKSWRDIRYDCRRLKHARE